MAVDAAGDVFIADQGNGVIAKVDPSGNLSIVAGIGNVDYDLGCTGTPPAAGPATEAGLCEPTGVAVDASGNVYIADSGNQVIEKVDPSGDLTILAGTEFGCDGLPTTGPATQASLCWPAGVAVDAAGNIYIADTDAGVIAKVDPSGNLTVIAGDDNGGFDGCDGSVPSPGPAADDSLCYPQGLAVDAAGNVYIADTENGVIEKVDLSGNLTILAGVGNRDFEDGCFGSPPTPGPATDATLCYPTGVAADSAGNVYIADQGHNVIEEVSSSGGETTGASAYDTSIVAPSADITATGTVDYSFYADDSCTGTAAATDTEAVADDGTVPNSATTAALPAGGYSYEAVYSGDSNYVARLHPVSLSPSPQPRRLSRLLSTTSPPAPPGPAARRAVLRPTTLRF